MRTGVSLSRKGDFMSDCVKVDTFEFDRIELGWDNLKKLVNSLGIAQEKLTLMYDFGSHVLYLTDKKPILRALDLLRIDYIVIPPSNTEVYIKKAL